MTSSQMLKPFVREAIYSIKDEIDRSPFQKRDITVLANEAGIGRNLLQRGFKALFGHTIKKYRRYKCMERAGQLLDEGKLSIKQVALRCGYKSQGNLSAAFKEVFGVTPREYQNRKSRK